MSLKAFHLIFIVAAILLCVVFGAWAWGQASGLYRVVAAAAFAAAAGLVVYGAWFVRKLKGVSYL